MSRRLIWSDEDIEYLKDNYGKKPFSEIKEEMAHINWKTLRRKAGELGLTGDAQKFTRDSAEVNHNFFSVPNPVNSYIAGFISADGCIVKDRILQVSVNRDDEAHLKNMLDLMESTASLNLGQDNTVRFSIPSTQIAADLLKNFNITPRKSLSLCPPKLSTVANRKAFIAGYIDGDGCFRYGAQGSQSNWKYLILEIVGTKQMLEWIASVVPHPGTIRQVENYYVLQINCKKAFEVYNFLHNPALPILERKWDRRYRIWSPRAA